MAAAASRILPCLELVMLASQIASMRARDASDEEIAEALPARTLAQRDFRRAAALIDDLHNDETDCVTKQRTILSFVFSGRRNATSSPPNLTGIKGLVTCDEFGQLEDVGSALGRQMGWLGCIDVDGSLTSYLNFTAERIREHLLEDAAPILTHFDVRQEDDRVKRSDSHLKWRPVLGC